jgi:RNA polymerase sigma-70 factor (ECF subfamily)
MSVADDDFGQALDRYRPYLRLLAQARLDPRLQGRLDASDIVQQTLLDAYKARDGYRGRTNAELGAWLRRILVRNLLHAVRDVRCAKRDIQRDRPLDVAAQESSARLERWLASEESSPSNRIAQMEEILKTTQAVAALPDGQREAIVLYYWQGCSLAEIGEQLGRSHSAVAGLLHRGLRRLRRHLSEPQ